MEESYKEIEVKCPFCEAVKEVKIPMRLFSQKKFGTIKIQVPQGAVCNEHQFIVFIDLKGKIIGYDKIDLSMRMFNEQQQQIKQFSLQHFIDLFGLYGVLNLIHAKIFNYPSYIVKDKDSEDYLRVINIIGERLLPESYRGTSYISYLDDIDYDKMELEKNALVIDAHKHILQTPWEEKLKFEENIISKALEIMDEEEQLILIQQNISKFVREAEYVKRILEKEKEIFEVDLMERMARELMIAKPSHYRITLLKDFIKQRYSPKLPLKIKSKVEEFLGLL